MDHANIVKLFEVYNDENQYYLVSEFCDGGELFEKIRNIK
jgi:calcium-dependent protein kinase